MPLTVKQLIAKLKQMPPNAKVYWADHDHDRYEWNNNAGRVMLVDYNDPEAESVAENFRLEGKIVMIRP